MSIVENLNLAEVDLNRARDELSRAFEESNKTGGYSKGVHSWLAEARKEVRKAEDLVRVARYVLAEEGE